MKYLPPKTLWPLFLGTALLQFVGSVLYFWIASGSTAVQAIYAGTKVVMLACPPFLLWLGFRLPNFTLTGNRLRSVTLGLVSGLAISAVIYGTFRLFQADFLSFSGNITQKAEAFGIIRYYLPAAIAFSLLHSLFEEYFWRWYVVRGLENRWRPGAAMVLGAILFALHHYVVLSQFFNPGLTVLFGTLVGVGGLVWSWTYRRTGSLLGPWISHALVDGTLFYIGYRLIQSSVLT